MRIFKLVSQQYRAWSDCTHVQAGLALYWWQRLITFASSRLKAKANSLSLYSIISLSLFYLQNDWHIFLLESHCSREAKNIFYNFTIIWSVFWMCKFNQIIFSIFSWQEVNHSQMMAKDSWFYIYFHVKV